MTRNGSPSYLIQTPYGYHFRFKIPKDLKPHLDNKQELRYSLKTGSICEAKERARLLAGKIRKLFRKPKTKGNFMSSDFSENKVYSLIREYLTEVLEDDEKERVMLGRYRYLMKSIRSRLASTIQQPKYSRCN